MKYAAVGILIVLGISAFILLETPIAVMLGVVIVVVCVAVWAFGLVSRH